MEEEEPKGQTSTHTHSEADSMTSTVPGSQARHDCRALHCHHGILFVPSHEQGGGIRPPIAVRTCARFVAGDRLQEMESPWRGLYMYSQLFSCRIH